MIIRGWAMTKVAQARAMSPVRQRSGRTGLFSTNPPTIAATCPFRFAANQVCLFAKSPDYRGGPKGRKTPPRGDERHGEPETSERPARIL